MAHSQWFWDSRTALPKASGSSAPGCATGRSIECVCPSAACDPSLDRRKTFGARGFHLRELGAHRPLASAFSTENPRPETEIAQEAIILVRAIIG